MADDQSDHDYQSREESRIDTKGVNCSQGRVADLTGKGMRLIVSNADLPSIGDTQEYSFTQGNQTLRLTAVVRWTRKGSVFSRKGEVGVEFVDLPAHQRESLIRLAVQGEFNDSPESNPTVTITTPDLYAILAVSPYASQSEIGTAFRKLVKQWHPDRCSSPESQRRFTELHKAYSVLRDPTLRAQYNQRFGPDQHAA